MQENEIADVIADCGRGGARSTCLMGNERLCLANVLTVRLGRKETIASASPR